MYVTCILHIKSGIKTEEIWTQSCDKSPYIDRKTKKHSDNNTNATKNFDYTTIADQLRTVNWGNDSHPIGVFKPVSDRIPSFPLTANIKRRESGAGIGIAKLIRQEQKTVYNKMHIDILDNVCLRILIVKKS